MKLFFVCLLSMLSYHASVAQFAPGVGKIGTTAIHKDSSIFKFWATKCSIKRGYKDISNTALGYANVGDSSMATGMPGEKGVVSLGDSGIAILTFASPIKNGPGWDFAVFENTFIDTFLELAFVEVSSDGLNYFRFPATSLTQDTIQTAGFGFTQPTAVNNLAGKYRALYGTPFDLQELSSTPGLDINAITHVKIIDVVGSIDNKYATLDQYGHKVNDPWPTPFGSSGFDLDAVGVINSAFSKLDHLNKQLGFNLYPNPAKGNCSFQFSTNEASSIKVIITDLAGKEIQIVSIYTKKGSQAIQLDLSGMQNGLYFINMLTSDGLTTKKTIVQND